MAEDFAELLLEGATAGIDNYEKVTEPLKKHAKKLVGLRHRSRGRRDDSYSDESDTTEDSDPPRRSNTDQARSRPDRRSRGGDRRYVVEEYERRRGRTLSTGANPYGGSGPEPRYYNRKQYNSHSDSSLSPPPSRLHRNSLGGKAAMGVGAAAGVAAGAAERGLERRREDLRRLRMSDSDNDRDSYRTDHRPRRTEAVVAGASTQQRRNPAGYLGNGASERDLGVANRNGTNSARNNASSIRTSSVSSSSSSDLGSSSEDDRTIKKMRGKEYLSAGLAAVATIQAAKGLYASLEARDKRYEELKNGEITQEEARRKRNKARLQDVAAIGIAALGIKGAYSEWQEVQEARHAVAEQKVARKKRHKKRVELREREARTSGGRGRDGYRSA